MEKINFSKLCEFLDEGKQIEFTYDNVFSVIMIEGNDWVIITDFNPCKLAPKGETKWLISFVKGFKIKDKSVEEIFDNYLYDINSLRIS